MTNLKNAIAGVVLSMTVLFAGVANADPGVNPLRIERCDGKGALKRPTSKACKARAPKVEAPVKVDSRGRCHAPSGKFVKCPAA